jgi:hypothetical protein
MAHVSRSVVIAAALGALACPASKTSSSTAPEAGPLGRPSAGPAAWDLPNTISSFASEPLTRDPAFVRRTYVRGAARITVTLASFRMTSAQYDEWVLTSKEGYPQATLDVPEGSGNGFYQCAAPDRGCALLIQLRSGVHIEIRGQGSWTREDVDAIARGLPLRTMARATND